MRRATKALHYVHTIRSAFGLPNPHACDFQAITALHLHSHAPTPSANHLPSIEDPPSLAASETYVDDAFKQEQAQEAPMEALATTTDKALHTKHSTTNTYVTQSCYVQDQPWHFEVGRLARLADGGCLVRQGATTVLATVASSPTVSYYRRDPRSTPITIDYREKLYAVGRIPGTYNKREGAPKEHELLAGRRLERAIRPLLPRGYFYATDVTASVLSADYGTADPEVVAVNAASAALSTSDVPWSGPLGAVRVVVVNGEIMVNPKPNQGNSHDVEPELSMLVAATLDHRVTLVEASSSSSATATATNNGAGTCPESLFIEALRAGVHAAKDLILAQQELRAGRGQVKREAVLSGADPMAARRVAEVARDSIGPILRTGDLNCADRTQLLNDAKAGIVETLRASGSWRAEFARVPGSGCVTSSDVEHAFSAIVGAEMRKLAIQEGLRIDDRGCIDLRPLRIEADHIPVVHGSAVVDAGDTQALCTVTVGSTNEQQRIESLLGGEDTKRLFVHFSLPDFSMVPGVERGGPSGGPLMRHEMDRSSFIERALLPVLPTEKEFPFAVRLNAEALAADGGTGAAAVVGGCIAMADAGVPLKGLVAAVGVGLVSEKGMWNGERPSRGGNSGGEEDEENNASLLGQHELLVDPSGMEVSMGDMELRVAGTKEGITACQLDVLLPGGVPLSVIEEALMKAKAARLKILETMEYSLPHGPEQRADHAPMFGTVKVPPTSVGAVIGKEGSMIRKIENRTGAKVNVQDNGVLNVFAPSGTQYEAAKAAIKAATGDVLSKGQRYTARVVVVKDYGAYVTMPGTEIKALLHISDLSKERIGAVEDVVKVGDAVEVEYTGRDKRGSVRVSRKAVLSSSVPG